jgi:integrase
MLAQVQVSPLTLRIPKLGVHKPSGQARVVIDGKSFYLGKPGPETAARYRAFLATYLREGAPPATAREVAPAKLLVADLVASFLEEHATYYVGPDGRQTGELGNYCDAFGVLLGVAATLPAAEFSPRWFTALQKAMVAKGWSRERINDQVRRCKRLFKWGVRQELVPAGVYHGALAIEGLKRFRTAAPESPGVESVPQGVLDAALPHLPAMIAAMVRMQLLTGMCGGEIDRSGSVWLYRPTQHKTLHVGRDRVVAIGPEAQLVLAPWLLLDPKEVVFSAKRSEAMRAERRRKARKSKVQPSQEARAIAAKKRQGRRETAPGETYTVAAYRRAINRACEAAGVEPFAPARLRHNAAERVRKVFGVEVARCVLGHADVRTTELYSSLDTGKAVEAAARLG